MSPTHISAPTRRAPTRRAPTRRELRGFAARRPGWFAVLVSLAYILPLIASWLLDSETATFTASPLLFAEFAWRLLLPTALLSVLGWWGVAGFTRAPTWRSLVPFLPLILYYGMAVVALLAFLGVASHGLGYYVLVAVAVLTVGFGDEAIFRGVVLQTLLPRGAMRAVVLSSALWGAQYLGVMASGFVDPGLVAIQALHMVGMGVAFAAVVVVTRTIWPVVLIDALTLLPTYILPARDPGLDIFTIVIELALGALAAGYGIWLLRRQGRWNGG